ncbi:Tetratricopeptide repeat-containing protein [Asanoa hainanensis]|uniref:Tetratricopeptide repeat-containing protein n=2 Tax=Asanoa hainanensis TaxID=560556 RepID=A0A239H4M0_9ACTN|nr:Tetratricopeptide repeat-containing protein [Asanoa hainanensis]
MERLSWVAGVAALLVALIASRRSVASRGVPSSSELTERDNEAAASVLVRNLPARNPAFIGRDDLIVSINNALTSGPAVINALHGWGGVGKTQTAIEYSYRYADDYDVVWWFVSEQPQLLAEQYAQLAVALGVAPAGSDTMVASAAARRCLRERQRWLIIFDNAEDPEALRPWIPDGAGHVLITSRRADWRELATPVRVDVLPRAESVALLTRRTDLTGDGAHLLADKLGDLPLALVQAAGFISETSIPIDDYLASLEAGASRILQEGRPASYPLTLPAAVKLAAERVRETDLPAWQLLRLCAALGPEPIPLWLFTGAADRILPTPLSAAVKDPVRLRGSIGLLARLGLARVDKTTIQLHRLTQSVLRSSAPPRTLEADLSRIRSLLVGAQPPDTDDPRYWPTWAALAPHILAIDSVDADEIPFRELVCGLIRTQLKRGEIADGLALIQNLHRRWSARYHQDELTMLHASFLLGHAYYLAGLWPEAQDMDAATYAARLRLLGPDHPDTLESANNLGGSLTRMGNLAAGRALDHDTLARRRRTLGDDHPDTLRTANNFASTLRKSGEFAAAKALHQDTWGRSRRVHGAEHPATLISAFYIGMDLIELGEFEAAYRQLDETHSTLRRVLGESHPATLQCADQLAIAALRRGDRTTAQAILEETLARRREVLGDSHPDVAATATKLAAMDRT